MIMSDLDYKSVFANHWAIEEYICAFLEPEIITHLNLDSLTQYPTESIGGRKPKQLPKQRLNDIMWKINYHNDDELYLLFMIEAQNTVQRGMAIRIGEYVFNWYAHLHATVPAESSLPMIFPTVFYNGNEPWRASTSISSLIEAPKGFKIKQPTVEAQHLLIDGKRELQSRSLPHDNVFLPLLKSIHATSYREFLEQVEATNQFARDAGQSDEYIDTINAFIYALQNIQESQWFASQENEGMKEMVARGFPTWEQEFLQQGIEQGMEQGIEQGMEQGIEQGAKQTSRTILRNLLQQRFGDLGDAIEARLDNADRTQLDQWLRRVVVVSDLNEVFE